MRCRSTNALTCLLLLTACAEGEGRPVTWAPFDPDGETDDADTGAEPNIDLGTAWSHRPSPPPTPPTPDDLPDDTPDPANQVCYPGAVWNWATCLALVQLDDVPDGYDYPTPMPGLWNYRAPIAYLDLDALDPDIMLAPDFRLGEIARAWKGRYAVVQPHAVEQLQLLRDELGAIKVDSGYRPPTYNAMIGGAEYSRHMYGDAFDLEPLDASPEALEDLCVELGGHLFEYDTHVHCDWRDEPLDERFFGPAD